MNSGACIPFSFPRSQEHRRDTDPVATTSNLELPDLSTLLFHCPNQYLSSRSYFGRPKVGAEMERDDTLEPVQ